MVNHTSPSRHPSRDISSSQLSTSSSSLRPAASSSKSNNPELFEPLPYKVLPILATISFPRYNDQLYNYNLLYLLFQLCLFRHELLRTTWELQLKFTDPPFLDAGMVDRIASYARDLTSLQRKIDGDYDTRIATFSSSSGSVYDTMLTFQLFETKLLELLTYLTACEMFKTPLEVWPELAAFVYRCREQRLDLALLGHQIAAELVKPNMVSFLVMLDRFIATVVSRDPKAAPVAPLSIEEGIMDLSDAFEDQTPYAIQLWKDEKILRMAPDVGCTLCEEHLSMLLQTLGVLAGSEMFGLLPLKGFARSPKDGTLHVLFEIPVEADRYSVLTLKEVLGNIDASPGLEMKQRVDLAIKIARVVYSWDAINLPSGPLLLEDFLILQNGRHIRPYFRNFNRFCGCRGTSCPTAFFERARTRESGQARSNLRELHERQIESLGFLLLQIFEWRDLEANISQCFEKADLFTLSSPAYDAYARAVLNAISGRASERWADREAKAQDLLPINGFGRRILSPLLHVDLSHELKATQILPDDKEFLKVTIQHVGHALSVQPYGIFDSLNPSLRTVGKQFQLSDFQKPEASADGVAITSEIPDSDGSRHSYEGKRSFISSPWPARKSSLVPARVNILKESSNRMVFPVYADPNVLDCWHNRLLPRIEKLINRIPPTHKPSSLSIDLLGVGATRETSRPTIVVTCGASSSCNASSVGEYLKRKLAYDPEVFDFKVRKGAVRRCSAQTSVRNLKRKANQNLEYQQAPVSGASIGAVRDGIPLPPGTFGGVVQVDEKVYGMTVHHLLDPLSPEDLADLVDEEEADDQVGEEEDRSGTEAATGTTHEDASFKILDTESLDEGYSEDDCSENNSDQLFISDAADDESHNGFVFDDMSDVSSTAGTDFTLDDPGDIPGLDPSHTIEVSVNQPCIYDSPAAAALGTVAASSGLRRTRFVKCLHELDWALLELQPLRHQGFNIVKGGGRFVSSLAPVDETNKDDVLPNAILKTEELGDRLVHSNGRSSGLQLGRIGPAMSALILPGRQSAARCWCVMGQLGDSGDSGTWVIDNLLGAVAGMVIASCETGQGYRLAYITPMEVVMEDVKAVMQAQCVQLPLGTLDGVGKLEGEVSKMVLEGVEEALMGGVGNEDAASLEKRVYGVTRPPEEQRNGESDEVGSQGMANAKVDIIAWSMAVSEMKKMEVEMRDEMVCV